MEFDMRYYFYLDEEGAPESAWMRHNGMEKLLYALHPKYYDDANYKEWFLPNTFHYDRPLTEHVKEGDAILTTKQEAMEWVVLNGI